MSISKKPTYQQLEKERDMWEEDFKDLWFIVNNMSLWQRIKFLITKGVR